MKSQKRRDIYPNVDLYSASIYYMLKIPVDLNTPIFAISRVAGWAAHIIEEKFAESCTKASIIQTKKQSMLESIADHKVVNTKH